MRYKITKRDADEGGGFCVTDTIYGVTKVRNTLQSARRLVSQLNNGKRRLIIRAGEGFRWVQV